MNQHKRIFMSAADQGGGGGSPPAPGGTGAPAPTPPAPAPTPAPGAPGAAPPAIDVKAIAEGVRDSLFAELRRAGVLGKPTPPPKTTPADPASTTAAAADPNALRSLDRVLGRSGFASKLDEQQYSRVERAFVAEAPDDVEGWVQGYFKGFGDAPATNQAPAAPAGAPGATTAAPPQRSVAPVSGGSSPPAPVAPLEERPILSMSAEDRAHLIRQKGVAWYRQKLATETKGMTVSVR